MKNKCTSAKVASPRISADDIHFEVDCIVLFAYALIFSAAIITIGINYNYIYTRVCRSQWPRGLRRRSTAGRLVRSWVRIPPGACMFVCCECCVLSGRGLCDELITRPEESYRLWRVVVCDQETL